MKTILYLLLFLGVSAQAQDVYIFNKTASELIKGRYGVYSELMPIKLPDGLYMLPTNILSNKDLLDSYNIINSSKEDSTQILILPDVGVQVFAGRIYKYVDETGTIDRSMSGLIKCVQTHNRTIYPPYLTPALFSFFRENSDTLTWIPNEYVYLGWKRVYEETTYTVIQEHMTLSTWTPDVTPTLWVPDTPPCSPWVQPTGAHDAYNIGDCVIFNGNQYESRINANVWSPSVYPAGWRLL